MCAVGRAAVAAGLAVGSGGNISAREPGGDTCWITAAGTWLDVGPVTVWIRLLAPVVEGEEPSPLQRVAAAADFGNGVSRVLSWETHVFINPELTVHLLRPAEGAWICLDARTLIGGAGIGMAESALYDERGRIGGAAQSLIVDARPPLAG